MSGRSYLSIGDVLTLLRQEFPDVTISKIRFLESQGLVNPERTPSGYRKFYDQDVERLRWVLRQQREHFLPLKVIKDRLEDDGAGEGTSGSEGAGAPPVETEHAASEGRATEHAGGPAEEPVLVGQRVVSGSLVGESSRPNAAAQRPVTRVAGGTTLPGIETADTTPPASASPPGGGDRSATGAQAPVVRPGTSPVGSAASSQARRGDPAPPGKVAGVGGSEGADENPSGSGKQPRSAPSTTAGPPARQRRPRSTPTAASPSVGSGNGSSESAPDQSGTNMSIEELAASSGLDREILVELQGYGLLTPTVLAGLEYFDEQSLVVATAVARFAQFGIEPRHLRPYKNAAVREAGFIEQIVLPLLRQRNPESRARARETVDELSDLGLQLQGALLRIALRGMLGD
jgi:DNA-binding transcriptional MerR regulator